MPATTVTIAARLPLGNLLATLKEQTSVTHRIRATQSTLFPASHLCARRILHSSDDLGCVRSALILQLEDHVAEVPCFICWPSRARDPKTSTEVLAVEAFANHKASQHQGKSKQFFRGVARIPDEKKPTYQYECLQSNSLALEGKRAERHRTLEDRKAAPTSYSETQQT